MALLSLHVHLAVQVSLHPALLSKLQQEMVRMCSSLHGIMPAATPSYWTGGASKVQVDKYFRRVLQEPAVLLLQHWLPQAFDAITLELDTLKGEVVEVVSEYHKRESGKKKPTAEAKHILKGYPPLSPPTSPPALDDDMLLSRARLTASSLHETKVKDLSSAVLVIDLALSFVGGYALLPLISAHEFRI